MNDLAETALARVVRRFCPQGRLLGHRRLTGGVSAEIHALEIALPGGGRVRRVLRRHGAADLAVNPDVAADEARLLELMAEDGLAVPRVHYLDVSCDLLPTPYLVIDFVAGDWLAPPADPDERTRPAAAALARIHRWPADDPRLAFLARRDPLSGAELTRERAAPEDAAREASLRAALAAHGPLPASGSPVLLHGDFWPGNLLWHDGRLAAVLDWEDAGLGDPLVDLAQARLEMLWAWGAAAAARFTRHYAALRPFDAGLLRCYDHWAALRALLRFTGWGLGADELAAKRAGIGAFVAGAAEP